MNPYHNHVYGFIPSFPIKGHPEIESPESKQQKVLRNATSSAFRLFVLWRLGSSIGFGEAPCHGDVGTCLWRPWGFPGYVPEIGIVKVRDGWTWRVERWEDGHVEYSFWMDHSMMLIRCCFIILMMMVMMTCMFRYLFICFSFLFIPEFLSLIALSRFRDQQFDHLWWAGAAFSQIWNLVIENAEILEG